MGKPCYNGRALVDNLLQFDLGALYGSFAEYFYPPIFHKQPESAEAKAKVQERLSILDGILSKRQFVTGDSVTIADISIMCSLHTPIGCGFDLSPYSNITSWRERCKKALPFFDEVTSAGVESFTGFSLDKMVIKLYFEDMSPPCQTVQVTAKALGIDLDIVDVDLFVKQEHKAPEYLKMNPAHTIPTIDDEGFYLWESRAIAAYLSDQYGKDDKLYPRDPKKRALVDNMLQFDLGSLYSSFASHYFPTLFLNKPEDPEVKARLLERLEIFDGILAKRNYAAGDHLTIADISLMCSLHVPICCGMDLTPYTHVNEWRDRVKKIDLPYFDELVGQGVKGFKEFCQNKLVKNPA
ncbi:Glutathione S-transferase [Chamberlinius hualienensis]